MDMIMVTNIVLVGVLFIGTAVGFAKGFLEQAIEFLGVVASFILAIFMSGAVTNFAVKKFSLPYSTTLVVVAVILFFAGLMVAHFIARWIGHRVKMTLLGWLDRLAGAALGLVVAMILSSFLITLALHLPFPKSFQKDVQRAPVSLFLKPIAGQIYNFVVAHGPRGVRFEQIFKETDTV